MLSTLCGNMERLIFKLSFCPTIVIVINKNQRLWCLFYTEFSFTTLSLYRGPNCGLSPYHHTTQRH